MGIISNFLGSDFELLQQNPESSFLPQVQAVGLLDSTLGFIGTKVIPKVASGIAAFSKRPIAEKIGAGLAFSAVAGIAQNKAPSVKDYVDSAAFSVFPGAYIYGDAKEFVSKITDKSKSFVQQIDPSLVSSSVKTGFNNAGNFVQQNPALVAGGAGLVGAGVGFAGANLLNNNDSKKDSDYDRLLQAIILGQHQNASVVAQPGIIQTVKISGNAVAKKKAPAKKKAAKKKPAKKKKIKKVKKKKR